jgi:hypothetical protein
MAAKVPCQQRDSCEANQPHHAEDEEEAPSIEVERAARQLKRCQRKWWRHHRRSGERARARGRQARLHTLEIARRHETRQARIAGRLPYPVGQRSADKRCGGDDRRKDPEDLAMPC